MEEKLNLNILHSYQVILYDLKYLEIFLKKLQNSTERFLLNKFYSDFNFKSKNLKVLFSKSENPYDLIYIIFCIYIN